jgi:sulfide:quinone oxidoreductase
MAEIVKLDETVFVAGQITPEDIDDIAGRGIKLIVNNRPDGEDPAGQPLAEELEAAARKHGIAFENLQFTASTLTPHHAARLAEILKTGDKPMLAFCRTGTRSTTLWAASSVAVGMPLTEAIEKAAQAGYDLRQSAPMIEHLAEAAKSDI